MISCPASLTSLQDLNLFDCKGITTDLSLVPVSGLILLQTLDCSVCNRFTESPLRLSPPAENLLSNYRKLLPPTPT